MVLAGACLCSKLKEKRYDEINRTEIAVLRQAWKEAPQLFRSSPATRRAQASRPTKLAATYSTKNVAVDSVSQFDFRPEDNVYVRIYHIIQRSDRLQRICAYAFAKLHSKNTSVDHILNEIKHAFPDATKDVVYRILHVGTRWIAIVQELADVTGLPREHLTGVLCLFSSSSSWERAKEEDRRLALRDLCRETDLLQQVRQTTPAVTDVLCHLLGESSFVYESVNPRPIQALPAPGRNVASMPTHNPAWDAEISWINPSLLAARADLHSTVEPGLSDDAHILFLVLSRLAIKEPVQPAMLLRGATSRKRWTQTGEVSNTESTDVGLVPELASFLSDVRRLDDAFRELARCQPLGTATPAAVHLLEDGLYSVDEATVLRLNNELSCALLSFWKGQALIVAYRAIPWKYLEPFGTDTLLFIPHLQNTLQEIRSDDMQLSTTARIDLALTLVEAARFPETATDVQTHAVAGQTLIQRALNDIQAEHLDTAEKNLTAWSPLDPQHPSPLEQTVLFRQAMIRGRLLRFRGSFSESRACLEGLVCQRQQLDAALVWDEELRDLTCDLADTLRELGRLDEAETCLQVEITRRQGVINCTDEDGGTEPVRTHQTGTLETRECAFLDLALAEVQFARGALQDARDICTRVLAGRRLRFCTLRGHIILAKVHQVWGNHQLASHHWTEALKAIAHFTLTNGHTTQVILASARENMRHLAQDGLAAQSEAQLAALQLSAAPEGGMQYWIAGMQQWSREHRAMAAQT